MNKTKFMQTDSRWGGLGYPKKPWYIRNCGCGEVSIANILIEMEQYKTITPATIQPYCKQYAAPNGDGTYWSGIPKMMEHYGLTEVKEHATMPSLWMELEKGDRVAVYLMGSRKGGSKGVHWTSGGHFVCSVDYKVKDGKHYVYVKDSYSNSGSRNGWITYEGNMRNDVIKVWSGKLNSVAKVVAPSPVAASAAPYKPSTPFKGTLPKVTVKYGSKGRNVKRVKHFLNWCIGTDFNIHNGKCGAKTVKAIRRFQKRYKLEVDGVFGKQCRRKAKQIVDKYAKKYAPTPQPTKPSETVTEQSIVEKVIEACKVQADWMKNYTYKWQNRPTIAKSKKYGTCVTYVACVLQRLGVLKRGQYIWIDENGKVIGATSKMKVTYLKGTLKSNRDKLKRGDIVIGGNGNIHAGGGSHIFIMTGKWKGDDPYIFDQASADRVRKGKGPSHTWNGGFKTIARIRLK